MDSLLKVIAEPRRQQILELVWTKARPAGEIAGTMNVTFGAVSQHLKILRDAGAVTMESRGRFRLYRANRKALGPLAAHLESLWRSQVWRMKRLAAAEEMERGRAAR